MAPRSRPFSEEFTLLREHALLSELSDDDVAAIGRATIMTHCRPGQVILSPDDPSGQVHIVTTGTVRAYRLTPDGRQLTLDICGTGTIVGDMRLLGHHRVPDGYAETIGAAVIFTIPPDELRSLVERRPMIGMMLITFLSRRLREAQRELEAMAYQRAGPRLAGKLIDLGHRFGVETARGTLIQVRLTQQDLAELIGTTRETLAHTLADFRRRDLIDAAHQQVVIRDAERLAEVGGHSVGALSRRRQRAGLGPRGRGSPTPPRVQLKRGWQTRSSSPDPAASP